MEPTIGLSCPILDKKNEEMDRLPEIGDRSIFISVSNEPSGSG